MTTRMRPSPVVPVDLAQALARAARCSGPPSRPRSSPKSTVVAASMSEPTNRRQQRRQAASSTSLPSKHQSSAVGIEGGSRHDQGQGVRLPRSGLASEQQVVAGELEHDEGVVLVVAEGETAPEAGPLDPDPWPGDRRLGQRVAVGRSPAGPCRRRVGPPGPGRRPHRRPRPEARSASPGRWPCTGATGGCRGPLPTAWGARRAPPGPLHCRCRRHRRPCA